MSENREIDQNILTPNDFGKLEEYCTDASIQYLKDSLDRLEHEMAPTPSFPLYGKRDESVVLSWVKDHLEKSDLPRWLIEYEKSRLEKFGGQGGHPAWKEMLPNFLLYKTAPKDVKFVDSEIMTEMTREYAQLHCRKRSVLDALNHLKRSDKIESRAAGWNQFEMKKTDPAAQTEAIKLAKNGGWKQGVGYTAARYNKLKPRIFMPMPFSSMIKQAQYFISFLGNIQLSLLSERWNSPYIAWADKVGFDKCFEYMERECQTADIRSNETLVYFSNDFEKMDTRTGSSQYKEFFIPVLNAAFHSNKDPELEECMMFTTTAPIYSPSGTMTGNHGTASGAEVTNGGECCGNDYFQRRFLKVLRKILPHGWRVILRRFNGDDSAFIFAITISVETFKQSALKSLDIVCKETGWDIQFDKLDFSTEFGRYCQNVYNYDVKSKKIFWTYPTVLIFNSIQNPEKEYKSADWDKDFRDIDVITKCDNGKDHPLFHEMIDFIQAGMKYPLLGATETETKRILSKYDRYRELQTLGERYNRTDYDISMSPTIKYILDKRKGTEKK